MENEFEIKACVSRVTIEGKTVDSCHVKEIETGIEYNLTVRNNVIDSASAPMIPRFTDVVRAQEFLLRAVGKEMPKDFWVNVNTAETLRMLRKIPEIWSAQKSIERGTPNELARIYIARNDDIEMSALEEIASDLRLLEDIKEARESVIGVPLEAQKVTFTLDI